MHAQLTTWRIRAEDRDGLKQTLAPALAKLRRQPGQIATYWIDGAEDIGMIFSLWETPDALDAGFRAIAADHAAVADRMELLERRRGPAEALGSETGAST